MAENNSEFQKMGQAVADQFRTMVQQASEPAAPGEQIVQRIRRAARRLGITEGQAKRGWYGEYRRIPADLYFQVQERVYEIEERQLERLRQEVALREARIAARKRKAHAEADDLAGPSVRLGR